MVTRLLEFTILTASRLGEARDPMWNEIDFKAMTWKIPAERMKMGKEHTIPFDLRPNFLPFSGRVI